MTFAYIIPGGVRNDMPGDMTEKALKTFDWFEKRLQEYEKILLNNPILEQRTRGVGVLSARGRDKVRRDRDRAARLRGQARHTQVRALQRLPRLRLRRPRRTRTGTAGPGPGSPSRR